MTEALKAVFERQVTFGNEAGYIPVRENTAGIPVMRYVPEKPGYRALADIQALSARLEQINSAGGLSPLVIRGLAYLLAFMPASEHEYTPLQDPGIECQNIEPMCLADLAEFWNPDLAGYLRHAVTDKEKIRPEIAHLLVNVTVMLFLCPIRSVSVSVFVHLTVLIGETMGPAEADRFKRNIFSWGYTYAELAPVFAAMLQRVQDAHLRVK